MCCGLFADCFFLSGVLNTSFLLNNLGYTSFLVATEWLEAKVWSQPELHLASYTTFDFS